MQWHAGKGKHVLSPNGYYFSQLEDGTSIEIHSNVYDRRFQAYLERLGVQQTSWQEIMYRAQQEWQNYCMLMDHFAQNTQQWLDTPESGIFIELPKNC